MSGKVENAKVSWDRVKMRFLGIGFVAMFITTIGLSLFMMLRPVEGAPGSGTCLPIEKGGTGCEPLATADGVSITSDGDNVFSSGVTYSTTEQPTGDKWVNGKNILRRTFNGTLTGAANTGQNLSLLTNSGIEEIIKIYGYFKTITSFDLSGDVIHWPIPSATFNTALGAPQHSAVVFINETSNRNLTLRIFSVDARNNSPFYVTLEYTKV